MDCGSGVGFKFISVHVDEMASTSVTCECKQNVQTDKKAKVVSFDGTISHCFRENIGMVYTTLITGIGFTGYDTICNSIGIQTINRGAYYHHCKFLFKNVEQLKKRTEAVLTVLWDLHAEEHFVDSDVDDAQVATVLTADGANDDGGATYLDLEVSYDGTWMKCGHQSHICLVWICGSCSNRFKHGNNMERDLHVQTVLLIMKLLTTIVGSL